MDNVMYVRKWLNTARSGGTAAIEAKIGPLYEADNNFDAELTITDCSRKVALDFSVYDDDSSANIREKITTLRRVIVQFEAMLKTQIESREAK